MLPEDKPLILFINSPESDGVQDLMYNGLARVLGPSQVIDYPWNLNFHINKRSYPANLGYTPGSLLPSLSARHKRRRCDIVVVAAAKPQCFRTYLACLDSIPSSVPVVFLDGGDFSQPGGDLQRLKAYELYEEAVRRRPFDAVFKREYLADARLGDRVWPLQFCFNFDRLPQHLPALKKYDVAFWAVESNPVRTRALQLVEERFDCGANGTIRNQKARHYMRRGAFYLQELAACRIVLNFPGVGWDTQRYWEVPALGRCMISMKPQISIPNNFVDREHVVFCKDDLSDLVELCDFYLRNGEERERIAVNAHAHADRFHSTGARAEYMVERLLRLL